MDLNILFLPIFNFLNNFFNNLLLLIFTSTANCFCVEQTPRPLQLFGHVDLSHATPSNPAKHEHSPDDLSQSPIFEHSTYGCASSSAVATDPQEIPVGHVLSEQSG